MSLDVLLDPGSSSLEGSLRSQHTWIPGYLVGEDACIAENGLELATEFFDVLGGSIELLIEFGIVDQLPDRTLAAVDSVAYVVQREEEVVETIGTAG